MSNRNHQYQIEHFRKNLIKVILEDDSLSSKEKLELVCKERLVTQILDDNPKFDIDLEDEYDSGFFNHTYYEIMEPAVGEFVGYCDMVNVWLNDVTERSDEYVDKVIQSILNHAITTNSFGFINYVDTDGYEY